MAKISLITKLPCAEGKNDEFEAALADMITASNEEAGLEIYSAHKADDDHYWFFELYSDQVVVDGVEIGAADPAGDRFDQHLTGTGREIVDLVDHHLAT